MDTHTVTQRKTYDLIKGVFTPDEAGDILFDLIWNKIRLHNMKILASMEKDSIDPVPSEERIRELQGTKLELERLFAEARSRGEDVVLECGVKVTFRKP